MCCCRWEERVTHVVAPSLKRVAKVLAAMAAGAWIVSTEFLTASHAAHTLVDPVLPIPSHASPLCKAVLHKHNVACKWGRRDPSRLTLQGNIAQRLQSRLCFRPKLRNSKLDSWCYDWGCAT